MFYNRTTDLFGDVEYWYKIINISSYWIGLVFVTIWTAIKRKEVFPKTNYVWNFLKCFGILSSFYFAMTKMIKVAGNWFNGGHSDFFGGMFTAFIIIPIAAMILLSKPMKTTDYFAPLLAVILMIFKSACHVAGCCYGKEWTYGIYSFRNSRFEFPTQLTELTFALLICIFLIWYMGSKYYKRGTCGPWFIMLYSGTRFLVEFVRDDFQPIFGPFNVDHIQCFVSLIIGYCLYIVLVKYGERIDDWFEAKAEPVREKIYSKLKFILSKNERELRTTVISN